MSVDRRSPPTAVKTSARSFLPLLMRPSIVAAAMVVVVFVIGVQLIPDFASMSAIDSVLILASSMGIATIGETGVILLGGIDLAVPFIMDMSDTVTGQLQHDGWPLYAAVLLALVLGGAIGAFDGYVSSRLKVHPLIVTLGVGYVVQGAVEVWTNGNPTGQATGWLSSLASPGSRLGGLHIAPVVLLWLGLAVIAVLVFRRTAFGRRIYAVGSSPRAATFANLSPSRVWTLTFMWSGVFASVAGVTLLSFSGSPSATAGDSYLFLAVGGVVVGGTALTGGRGGYGGTIIAVLLLTLVSTVTSGAGYSESAQEVIIGIVILAAVAAFGREAHVRDRI